MNASEGDTLEMASEVTEGHNALLRTFLDFDLDAVLGDPGADPRWDLRAAATFLTDRLATFALIEERQLPSGSPEREATALEHAVLRAETGHLLTEASPTSNTGSSGSGAGSLAAIRFILPGRP